MLDDQVTREPADHWTVRNLRRRWKPIKDGPAAGPEHEAIRVRLHRAWSWLGRVELARATPLEDDDGRVIFGWIALNSLYGRWDSDRREPQPEWDALNAFLDRLRHHDEEGRIAALLEHERDLVRSIVGDAFLNRHFWKEPTTRQQRRAEADARRLGSLYYERKYAIILENTLKRVYLARCQLVHGAATVGSDLNREALANCARFLLAFVPIATLIIVDHAWSADWGDLCYPPIDDGT